MTTRTRPYHTTQSTWKQIVSSVNIIPMNQRNYAWDETEIKKFIDDLFLMFGTTNYYEKMGTINYYRTADDLLEVWDGQQRLITIVLTLKAISFLCNVLPCKTPTEKKAAENFSNSIINSLTEDIDSLPDIPERIKRFKDNPLFDEFVNIPKIYCVYQYDNKAICEIFNNYRPLVDNLSNDSEDDVDDDDDNCDDDDPDEDVSNEDDCTDSGNIRPYKCKCGASIRVNSPYDQKSAFVAHLVKSDKHIYDDSRIKSKDTNIYKAYEYICKRLYFKFHGLKSFKEFYQYILNYIDLNVCEYSDYWYVSRSFDWENNRGKLVHTLDVIKNTLLASISLSNQCEIYQKWTAIREKTDTIYSDFGERIMNCAIQIYSKKIESKLDQELLFTTLVKSNQEDTYKAILSYFKIVDKLFGIYETIRDDRYGRLMLTNKRCSLSWEGYMYFLFPVFYFNNNVNPKTVELFTRWCFRNLNTKNRVLNNLCYATELISISNSYINNRNTDYHSDCVRLFQKNKDFSVNDVNYVTTNADKSWKQNRELSKLLLYFLETATTPDDHKPVLTHDLEHIYPENKKSELSSPSDIYKLGNLTIFEAKNSKNGHKGNRSIKDNSFVVKKEQYAGSSHKITRKLTEFNDFGTNEILERTTQLFTELNVYTNY